MSQNKLHTVLIEDNPADILLLKEAVEECHAPWDIAPFTNGREAVSYLRKEGEFQDRPHVDLVLLDLNLPGLNGRDLLKEIKQNDELSSIPVIVLTTSSSPVDVHYAYSNHANAYITKPVDLDAFAVIINSIEAFWFKTATLPEEEMMP